MLKVIAWALTLLGTAVWRFGYFTTGTSSIVEWNSVLPAWISDY